MKKNIALITGGLSGESVISYKSATTIQKHLDKEKYNSFWIDIRKDGWKFKDENGNESDVDKNDFSIRHNGNKIKFDAALMALHGTPGEDGKLPGYFDMIGLPYTSCGAATSALTFNKRYTVAVASFAGIRVAKSMHIFKGKQPDVKSILDNLQLPYFVKPNNGGSSIGMSRVDEASELQAALDKAFAEDNQVLVEEFITGREFTVGVFKKENEIITLPLSEPIAKNRFFDFEAKYEGKSDEITPANLEEDKAEKIRDAAKKIYEVFNCAGIVRIDFIFNEGLQEPFMLEINTVPGQTEASFVPQQLAVYGMSLKDFYSQLIEECLNN